MIRAAILCDFAEEQWPSMDLCADMLLDHLASAHADHIAATRIQPRFRRRFSRIRSAASFANADRFLNRFVDYACAARSLRDFDLFHVTDHSYAQLVHALPAARTVVTCHDTDTFRCLLEPENEPRSALFRAMARRILSGLQKAALVICVSEATKARLLSTGLISPEKLRVIPNGIHPAFQPLPDAEWDALAGQWLPRVNGSFDLLHVGSVIPRKRIDLLLQIFARFRAAVQQARLIRVGPALTPAQQELASHLGVLESIVQFPRISSALLAAVYRRADALILPSEAEGFGLPLAEAMACGTPAVASDIPALRETGGSAACFAATGQIDAWVGTLQRLRQDAAFRRQRVSAGLHRSRDFSWARNSREIAALYRTVVLQTSPQSIYEEGHHHWRRRLYRL